ncbi:MAG TPA: DNA mismatch repair endonuclease MutL [Bacillota bacterium]|nr:DNA mismatch repair endonuclease MutL [Bacillota bacterium]
MGIIHILDDRLSNMIAAGEVVERPASVVKELVENSIDAKSTTIEVHIVEGGLGTIRIVDDGCGMTSDDCEACFERHATSKLRRERDLFHISSLGFRGEAIPSIASVAKVELRSSHLAGEAGTRIVVEGGRRVSIDPVSQPKGTEIIVRELFYNTPARLKYLKSIQTEVGHIADYLNRLAFAYPEISFLLTVDGRTVLKTYGDGQLLHVISSVYGMVIAKEMIPIEGQNLDFEVEGFVANPQLTRANRSYISILVNGRYIRNQAVIGAILRAYHTLLPINRFPIGILQLKMDPALVDVNVHPAKLEVRFSKEQELMQFIEKEIANVLQKQRLIPEPIRTTPKEPSTQTRIDWQSRNPNVSNAWKNEEPSVVREYTTWFLDQADTSAPEKVNVQLSEVGKNDQSEVKAIETERLEESSPSSFVVDPSVPIFYPLAQLHGTYILAQSEDGLYIIDQHAAQERIWYEYFLGKLAEEKIEMQDLLIPLSIHLSLKEMNLVQEKLPLFKEIGLDLEEFGNQTFIIRSHPRWFVAGEEEAIIHEMVEMIVRGDEKIDTVKLREKAAITMSCKAAIKANRHLNHLEMEALLNKLRETTSPYTCPHGRPIIIHFSTYELEKMFKRVM